MSALARRTFLSGAACLTAAGKQRPNILLLLADNWAWPHASVYGDPVVRTPFFDRLAREGMLFTHAFAPNPSCSPSRSLLLTGQDTHRLGEAASLYGNLSSNVGTYVDALTGNGYFAGFSLKGWGPGTPEKAGRTGNPAGLPFADFAAFLKAKPADHPFCFWFGSRDPHVKWDRGRQYRERMDSSRVRVPAHLPDQPAVREDILGYYCEVQQFDAECAEILDMLKARGELDKTLIVMTSDNGWQMPRGLANCYDLGVRIPMVIRWPERIKAGEVRDDFVSIGDLAPTFLEAAGLSPLPAMTTASLFSSARRNSMFVERERHANVRKGNLSYPVRGIRTADYLYLRNLEPSRWPAGDPEFYWAVGPYGDIDDSRTKQLLMKEKPEPFFQLCFGKRPGEELYALKDDPGQIHNVADRADLKAVKKELAGKVDLWMKTSKDPRFSSPHTDFWDLAPYSGARFKGAPPPN